LGYPVVGDHVYGKKGNIKEDGYSDITRKLKNMERQALHAYRLSFLHPVTGKLLDFISPLPSDMADLCASIKGEING
jgi:23S rRNA pseudouridine1911/1915/1917 synthase